MNSNSALSSRRALVKGRSVGLGILAIASIIVGCSFAHSRSVQTPTTVPPVKPEGTRISGEADATFVREKEIRTDYIGPGSCRLKMVALTFDDGPHPGFSLDLLRMLEQLHLHATFFVVGKMVHKYPGLVQAEVEAGNEIGNHTYNHLRLLPLTDDAVHEEIARANDAIQACTGRPAVLFRPPGGEIDERVLNAIRSEGMTTVTWTADPGDYLNQGPPNEKWQRVILRRLKRQIAPGGIILLHDGIPDSIAILPELVRWLHSQGYRIGTVTDMLLAQQQHDDRFPGEVSPQAPIIFPRLTHRDPL